MGLNRKRTPITVYGVPGQEFSTVQMQTERGDFSFTVYDNGEVYVSTPNITVGNVRVLDGNGDTHYLDYEDKD